MKKFLIGFKIVFTLSLAFGAFIWARNAAWYIPQDYITVGYVTAAVLLLTGALVGWSARKGQERRVLSLAFVVEMAAYVAIILFGAVSNSLLWAAIGSYMALAATGVEMLDLADIAAKYAGKK